MSDEEIKLYEAEIATLNGCISDLERRLVDAHAILADFVRETDAWNAAMEKILGRTPDYLWQTLERARDAIAAKP